MKKWVIRLSITMLLLIGAFGGFLFFNQQKLAKISSYEECQKAGFPILESYPPQCKTSDGRRFTQNVGNLLQFHDEIQISNPQPNQIIHSPIVVSGQARGMWYFEGSFSGELFDSSKKSLGTVVLEAKGDWMSENFVPFEGKLQFSSPTTSKGELIIKNANPSGKPDNEKEITIPVSF